MNRDAFAAALAREIEETLAIDPGGTVDRAGFERLAMDTHDWAMEQGLVYGLPEIIEDAFYLHVSEVEREGWPTPPDLLQRWKDWEAEYPTFAARHPKLELVSILRLMGEHVSYPGLRTTERGDTALDEGLLQDWVDQDSAFPLPSFLHPEDDALPSIHRRLKALRQRVGGWLFMDDARKFVFAPEAEWQAIRARRKAQAEERERQFWADKAWKEARERRVAEVVSLAKADPVVWEALKTWEQEALTRRQGGGRISLRARDTLSREEVEALDARTPLDPPYAEFLAGVRQPDEAFPVWDVISQLRGALWTELGVYGDWSATFTPPIGRT